MRKIILLLIGSISFIIKGQNQINFGDFEKPVPSQSYLSNYIDTQTSISTGVPSINIPLFSFKTSNQNLNINYTIDYHIRNEFDYDEPAGEIGTGWSLLGSGVISRKINGDVDEIYENSAATFYQKNEFDDIYYYFLPNGKSGKFKMIRDLINDTFSLKELSAQKIKIEYTRDYSKIGTLVVNSFKIIDDNGLQFIFDDYTQSKTFFEILPIIYKSSFQLTKILDPNNIELVTYNYQKQTKYDDYNNFLYQTSKLSNIDIKNNVKIDFSYNYSNSLENTLNDPYSISNVNIKDYQNNLQYSLGFVYSFMDFKDTYLDVNYNKRILNSLVKYNKKTVEQERHNFIYQQINENIPGMLKRIVYPSKGVVEYNFEKNETYVNQEDPAYLSFYKDHYEYSDLQYLTTTNSINFNTNDSRSYTFTVPSDLDIRRKVYVDYQIDEFYQGPIDPLSSDPGCSYIDENGFNVLDPNCSNPNPPKPEISIDFVLKKNNEIFEGYKFMGHPYTEFYLLPGTYTMEITGVGGRGRVIAQESRLKAPPYNNNVPSRGYRIARIKTYENQNDLNPIKTTTYTYADFTNAANTSGYRFFDESDVYGTHPITAYKNVKVSEGSNMGYKKYYFKSPYDYAVTNITLNNKQEKYWPYYLLTTSGIIDKMEGYSKAGNKNYEISYQYTFQDINATDYIKIYSGNYTKPAYITYDKQTKKTYGLNSTNYLSSSVENYYNANYKTSSSKEIASDGNIVEKIYKYPDDKNIQKLMAANIFSIPVETEVKSNGKSLGKTEIKYDNTDNLFPSSVVSTNPNDLSTKTTIKYDVYDSAGNLVQYTTNYDSSSNAGNPTTIIWGYNKSLPIAKIEGAMLSDIGSLADDIVNKSNLDIDVLSENTLLLALESFKNQPFLKNFFITTYTHDPIIGITTVTQPNGIREIYKYDDNNRLKSVTDANGNIIKEMKYNTKQ